MNLLILYSRDIDINDSGAARTTIELANYLADKDNVNVFSAFKILNGNKGNIKELFVDKSDLQSSYQRIIVSNAIDVVLVPEGYNMTGLIADSIKGLGCKLISAMHTKPGFETCRIHVMLLESVLFNMSIVKRIRALFLLLLFPVFYYLYSRRIRYKIRNAYNHSDFFILLSDKFFSDFSRIYKIKDNGKKLRSISNALSFKNDFFVDYKYEEKLNQCLVVARFDERAKRLSHIFRVWKQLYHKYSHWKLVIVGFGRAEKYYKFLVRMYGLKNVDFVGKQSPREYYAKSKLFFLTSAFEGFPMTITEAQQMGCVPIAMNTFDSVTDTIDSGTNGYIVDSIEEFVKVAAYYMNNPSVLEENARNAIELSKRFERDRIYEKYYSLLRECVCHCQ